MTSEEKIKALTSMIQTMLTEINYDCGVSKLTVLKANQLLAVIEPKNDLEQNIKTITITDTKRLGKVDLITFALRRLFKTTPYSEIKKESENLIAEIETQNKL